MNDMNVAMENAITVSEKAKEQVLKLMADAGRDSSYFLRVSVVGGGCSGPGQISD